MTILDYVDMIEPLEEIEYNPDLTRGIRRELGLNQHEFGTIIGVGLSDVWRWESGRTTPSSGNLGKICALYAENGAETIPVWKRGKEIISLNLATRLSG